MALDEKRLGSILESILLTAPEPVAVGRLVEIIQIEDTETEETAIRAALKRLIEAYRDAERPIATGIRLVELPGGLQFRTEPENAPFVRRFLAAKPQRLSKAALETLAIVAYRQPATKPEIEAVRGVDVGAALKKLLDLGMIRILGKREEVGRPLIYGTSPDFLSFFGLKSLSELPTLREYHELDEEHQRELEALQTRGSLASLAEVASDLVERSADPDLDRLDEAVKAADKARRRTEARLGELHPSDPPAETAPGSLGASPGATEEASKESP